MAYSIVEDRDRIPYSFFSLIMNEVVPFILDKSNNAFSRIAKAYAWYRFLCYATSKCPEDIPGDPRRWNDKTIEKVADKLIEYAFQITSNYMARNREREKANQQIIDNTVIRF